MPLRRACPLCAAAHTAATRRMRVLAQRHLLHLELRPLPLLAPAVLDLPAQCLHKARSAPIWVHAYSLTARQVAVVL